MTELDSDSTAEPDLLELWEREPVRCGSEFKPIDEGRPCAKEAPAASTAADSGQSGVQTPSWSDGESSSNDGAELGADSHCVRRLRLSNGAIIELSSEFESTIGAIIERRSQEFQMRLSNILSSQNSNDGAEFGAARNSELSLRTTYSEVVRELEREVQAGLEAELELRESKREAQPEAASGPATLPGWGFYPSDWNSDTAAACFDLPSVECSKENGCRCLLPNSEVSDVTVTSSTVDSEAPDDDEVVVGVPHQAMLDLIKRCSTSEMLILPSSQEMLGLIKRLDEPPTETIQMLDAMIERGAVGGA